jgi:UDP-glucose 4-epimerase
MKKVFITGVAGFLGSHLADSFISRGYHVIGIDNLLGGYRDNVSNDVEFYEDDLLNFERLKNLMSGCDLVYHTACTAYEGLSVFTPALVVNNTFQISVNAFTAAIQAGVGRFVHCSSMARYGSQAIYPFTEDMTCYPQDPYGIAKYSAEMLLKNLSEIHGLDLVIAVPHNIIGPRQKYDDPYRNVASIMINLMMQGRQPVIYGDGKQVRCFSDIEDDVSCLMAFAEDTRASGQIFNIGPDENPVTILELAEIIAAQLNFRLDPIFMADRPQEVKYATCSANKIRNMFGYETKISLEKSIGKLISYIDARGVLPFTYHLPLEIVSEKTPKSWTHKVF